MPARFFALLAASSIAAAACGPALAQDAGPDYSDEEMRASRQELLHHVGGQVNSMIRGDRFEHRTNEGDPVALWDLDAWIGGDLNKFWLKTEGEYAEDASEFEAANAQVLYSRAISPFFDLQLGYRSDFEPGPVQHYAVVGLQGLAPQWFEVDASVFVSDEGDLLATLETEYELLFTQRLVLQPRLELGASAQDVAGTATGAGLTGMEAGVRLRYEFLREFAPYVGVSWEGALGKTADRVRAAGTETWTTSFVAGLRWWF